MAVLFRRNLWKIWCHFIHVWYLSKSEEVKSHSRFQGKEILHSQRKCSKNSRKKADKTMLFIYFFVNRYNVFKYCYFMLHGQIEKFGKLAFGDHNLITSHQPAAILICIDPLGPWKYARSYHHSKLSLLIEYHNSRPAGWVHPCVCLTRHVSGQGK